MVMKASVEDDDSGWEPNIPEKMEKSNTSWIDITQDFEDCCRGKPDLRFRKHRMTLSEVVDQSGRFGGRA